VHDKQVVHDERVIRVRFAADPASVPGARRFVADGLRSWGHGDLVDDATLCVGELAGNAALHGDGTFIQVSVLDLDQVVRVCVEDDGSTPASQVAPRTSLPVTGAGKGPGEGLELDDDGLADLEIDALDLVLAPATGRGLAIVSVLACDWGVEDLGAGKRVWADLSTSEARADAPPPTGASRPVPPSGGLPVTEAPVVDALPEGWVTIRLAGCPVELSLHQDQHLDELVRELTLMRAGEENAESSRLARHLGAILRAPAHARSAGRRQAQSAHERGERLVDVEMAMPREFCSEVRALHAAVRQADELCEQQRLLTLTSSEELRAFRSWMTEEILAQAEQGATPRPWDEWLRLRT